MTNGKGDSRYTTRTKSPEFPDRWAQTFGVVTPSPQPNTNGDSVAIIEPPNPPDESP